MGMKLTQLPILFPSMWKFSFLWVCTCKRKNLSDFIYATGAQDEFEIAIPITGNSLPNMAPLYLCTYAGN